MPKVSGLPVEKVPSHFPEPIYKNPENGFTAERFALGKMLFFDPLLSRDSSISCASCHAQQFAFSDAGKALSNGVKGRTGIRNSPPVFNAAWMPRFMWDGGINHLEVMPIAPITEHVEMDLTLAEMISRLNNHSDYRHRFYAAYEVETIESKQVLLALSLFMANLISAESPFDKFANGETNALSNSQKEGYQLFKQFCQSCHSPPLFTDNSFRNNGLSTDTLDPGRYRITLMDEDKFRFKVPSLRNVAKTWPYLHNGEIYTLREVLDRYSSAFVPSSTLDVFFQSYPQGLPLSESDKEKLLDFLNALTDEPFLTNPDFADPFL